MLLNNEQVIIFPINLMRFNKPRVDSLFKIDRILPSVYIMTQQAHQVGLVTKFLVHLSKAFVFLNNDTLTKLTMQFQSSSFSPFIPARDFEPPLMVVEYIIKDQTLAILPLWPVFVT